MHLVVLYGTVSGTAKEAAQTIVFQAFERGFEEIVCCAVDEVSLTSWVSFKCPVVITCATAGIGEVPTTMRSTWDVLRMTDAPSLEGLSFAVFGLGDSSYEKFNFAAKMLHNRLIQLAAVPILHRGLGDDQDSCGYEEQFLPWLDSFWKALVPQNLSRTKSISMPLFWRVTTANNFVSCLAPEKVRRAETTSQAVIMENKRLTAKDHFQDVRHLVIQHSLSALSPGDAVGIYPVNPPSLVVKLLQLIGISPETTITVRPQLLRAQEVLPFFGDCLQAVDLFGYYLDISGIPSRRFFWMLSKFSTDEEITERLTELASPQHYDEYLSYCYREKRSYVDVLVDFASIKPPLDVLLNFIQPLRPRYYSISSDVISDRLSMTVAVLSFTTPYGQHRSGFCSTYLQQTEVAKSSIQCFYSPGHIKLPEHPCPLILVGPGTGVAPLRSIVQAWRRSGWSTELHLFVGHRNSTQDYLYGEEWEELHKAQQNFHLYSAFSREGPQKVYVQHLISQATAKLGPLIITNNAHVIVSGNSKQMPADVQNAFLSIIEKHLPSNESVSPSKYLQLMRSAGRYQTDCWSV